MIGLTPKQAKCLAFIKQRMAIDGVAPSFVEIAAALGIKSKSGAYRLLCGLEERGHIRRIKHRARAIEIVDDSPVMRAARRVVESIVSEDEEAGTVVVRTDAFGELDVALAEKFP